MTGRPASRTEAPAAASARTAVSAPTVVAAQTVTSARTMAEVFLARRGDPHPALAFEEATWSWDELVRQGAVRGLAVLERRREGPLHVGVLLENTPEHCAWIVGAALVGAAVVGINPTRRGEQLAADVRHTDCQLLVTDEVGRALLEGLDLGNLGPDRVLLVGDGVGPSPTELPDVDDARWAWLEALAPAPTDRLLLLFTSGSTGAPKAVIVSQGRMAGLAQRTPEMFGIDRTTVTYEAMPMFHGNAIMANWAPVIGAGATMALRRRFSASAFLPDVRRFGASYFNYVGRALAYVLATPQRPDDADNPLRLGFGTEASARDRATFEQRFGCRLVESYGSSEGPISIRRVPGAPPGSLGRPDADADVVICDPTTGRECPPARFDAEGRLENSHEAIGEIVGRNVAARFEGYYNNEPATAERLRDGAYWSGDLGYRDAQGWFYFAGRGTDRLRVDGENFAAGPIERILERYPPVVVAAVYPVPDPATGDNVMAALELADGSTFDAQDFAGFLERQRDLGTKWAPRFVRLVEQMPLTASHKVAKAALAAEQWQTTDPVLWRPDRHAPYRPLTDADRSDLAAAFTAHGRQALLPTAPARGAEPGAGAASRRRVST